MPAVKAVEEGLRALSERRYERLSVAAADEARDLVRTFNNSVTVVEEQFRALQTLGEIDQMLLGSAELEQMLESILERVQTVTRCHSVGITLRDADAPGRGRIYMAANGLSGSAGQPRRARCRHGRYARRRKRTGSRSRAAKSTVTASCGR